MRQPVIRHFSFIHNLVFALFFFLCFNYKIMFKANQQNAYVATKVVSIKPEAQINYNPKTQNQVRWLVPQYLGFIDPRSTYLKYNLKMSGRGHAKPDFRAGVHSLWRDMRTQDGTGSAELEMIQDYNVLTAQWWGYTQNESIAHKRDLFEGRSENTNIDEQLYFGAAPAWNDAAQTATHIRKNVEIQQPIYSGILGGNKVFPVVATKGLRCQMTLDNVGRSLVFNTNLGNFNNFVGSKHDKAAAGDAKVAIGSEFNIVIQQPADNAAARGVNRNASPTNNNPFDIGDVLYISDAADGANEEELGVITQLTKDADGDLAIVYIPARANGAGLASNHTAGSRVFYKSEDRINGKVVADVPAAQIAAAGEAINYEISDLEMLVLQVQPPAQYVEALQRQISSSGGLTMDFRSWMLYRFNLNTINGLTNQLIPANLQRAYSILSVPTSVADSISMTTSSLVGITDNAQNYQYVFRGNLIPDRPIDLRRFSQAVPKPDALALVELEKALVNADYGVRNLLRTPERFLIGRAFSKYNQIFNLALGDLALRVEYQGATQEKLYEHFVQYIRRINISPNGVMVSF